MNPESTPAWQRHASAILNGFLGDWLEARNNPLAVPMAVHHNGAALVQEGPSIEGAGSTVCLFIHGLMELETIWDYPGGSGGHYGSVLAGASGERLTSLSLRYNSGRPIHRNGQDLAGTLEQLVAAWPVPVERLVLVGHSMGGLLIRSACHYGQVAGHGWLNLLSDCVYLGSPHDGSWLAKGAKAAAGMMNQMPRDYLKVVGEVIDLRSEGIRNLSRGEVLEQGADDPPLVPGVRHYVICGLLARSRQHPVNALFGDALVHESSAQGRERDGWTLAGMASFPGVGHVRLAHHPEVAKQLVEWLV